jgi:NADH-quinone oxidoreductase subunit L
MVTAGVYLVCRLSFVFVLSPAAMFTVALVGACTALLAATIAFAQNDIKKVLAYSTVSQLGYMFLGVGVGAFTAGFFHVVTHAFFKACLFLGAGSVIHAMHARIHGVESSQDMRNMGGLRRYMPITFVTFLASWAAIVGFPGTSGFFSKDEILLRAYTSSIASPVPSGVLAGTGGEMQLFQWPTWGGPVLYGIGYLTALCTAFYMTRLLIGIFFGEFRGWTIVKHWSAGHDHDDHHHAHAHGPAPVGLAVEGPRPHESPWQMWLPLAILGGLALVAGFLNAHLFHLHPFDSWLAPVFANASTHVTLAENHDAATMPLLALAVAAFAVGVGLAYWVYSVQRGRPAARFVEAAPGLHRFVSDKWRVDELYDELVIGSVDSLAELSVSADKWVIDGILARFTSFLVAGSGTLLRYVQNGRVQAYAAFMVLGVGVLGWLMLAPRAEAKTVNNHAAGAYSVNAAPGLGYKYRWDANGDGQWDSEDFGQETVQKFSLDVAASRTVRLEVMNAFGRTASADIVVARPRPDRSGAAGVTLDVERGADGQLRGVPRDSELAPAPAAPKVNP